MPDGEIVGRVGVKPWVVADARRRLRIPRCPKPSRGADKVRNRLARMPQPQLERLLASLRPLDQAIVRERLLADWPATLADLAARLSVSTQAVSLRVRRLRGLTQT